MNKKIMILGASILQLPAIKKAKEMGLSVIAVDMNPDAIGFKEENVVKEIISTIDIPNVIEAAKKHKIDGIMTLASDMPMRTVAAVCKEIHLIGIDEQTAINATNKAAMRNVLKDNGVPIPMFFRVSTYDDFKKAIDELKQKEYKIIVKPADNSGSRGINLITKYDSNYLLNAFEYSKEYSRNGDVLVEEYMAGSEVSVETLTVDGICHVIQITDKLTTGAPYFVEMGHSQPSMLPDDVKTKIENVAIAANKAVGITNGPSHTEIKITKDGPKIVEIGARLGGDNITTHLVPLSTGVDMVEACIKIALGEKPDVSKKINSGSAIRYFESHAGVLKDIRGLDDARKIPGIVQVSTVYNLDDKINDIKSSSDRVGFVIAKASTPEEAISICDEALTKIKLEISNR